VHDHLDERGRGDADALEVLGIRTPRVASEVLLLLGVVEGIDGVRLRDAVLELEALLRGA